MSNPTSQINFSLIKKNQKNLINNLKKKKSQFSVLVSLMTFHLPVLPVITQKYMQSDSLLWLTERKRHSLVIRRNDLAGTVAEVIFSDSITFPKKL